jgi:hypothetical protein
LDLLGSGLKQKLLTRRTPIEWRHERSGELPPSGGVTNMRIKGIDLQNAPESVQPVFQGSLDFFGRVITPALVMAHRPEILLTAAKLGQAIGASTVVESRLKTMASVRAAQMVGCPF